MIPEIGQLALAIALFLALTQAILPLAGAATNRPAWVATARPVAIAQFLFVLLAFAALATSFLKNDFTVENVVMHSNLSLPAHYRFAASWGSHEGSMVLWALMLAGWTAAVAVLSKHLPERVVARVIGVMGLISVGFLLFILTTSSPFERVIPPPLGGDPPGG